MSKNPPEISKADRAMVYWTGSLARHNRTVPENIGLPPTLKDAMEARIVDRLKDAGLNKESLRGLAFTWQPKIQDGVYITVHASPDQAGIADQYFQDRLVSQNGLAGSFRAKRGPGQGWVKGYAAVTLMADSYEDMAKALGIGLQIYPPGGLVPRR